MEIEKQTEKQIRELQSLEQDLQNILIQKQAFEMELSEVENAFIELEKSKDDVYKISGSIMIKSDKASILKELSDKKKLIQLRLKSIDAQEKALQEETEKLREQVLSKIRDKN